MGQGTWGMDDSYDTECESYENALDRGLWIMRGGETIYINKMGDTHLKNTLNYVGRLYNKEYDYSRKQVWLGYISAFRNELDSRVITTKPKSIVLTVATSITTKSSVGVMVSMRCHCGVVYDARQSDLNRGWALSCGKSCAALRRANNLPAATKI